MINPTSLFEFCALLLIHLNLIFPTSLCTVPTRTPQVGPCSRRTRRRSNNGPVHEPPRSPRNQVTSINRKACSGLGKRILHALKDNRAQYGWEGLYGGLGPNIAGNASSWALCFLFYNELRNGRQAETRLNHCLLEHTECSSSRRPVQLTIHVCARVFFCVASRHAS